MDEKDEDSLELNDSEASFVAFMSGKREVSVVEGERGAVTADTWVYMPIVVCMNMAALDLDPTAVRA